MAEDANPPVPTETRTEWQQFFDWHAPRYLENAFTTHTKAEVDFILSLFPLEGGAKILDVGCGAGRHAIELAKRGFKVTGVDISEGMIREARKSATGLDIEFIRADATEWVSEEPFDAAICLCEGGFNLIGQTEDAVTHDLSILRCVSASLKTGAPFVLNALNGYALIRQLPPTSVETGSFDPVTMVATYQDTWSLPEGPTVMQIRERLFIPPEINALLYTAGFNVLAVYGGTAGNWGRRPLQLDEVEAMFVARKTR